MKSVYLAGPIKGLNYNNCTEWREYVSGHFPDIKCLSPMRNKEYLRPEQYIADSYQQHPLSTAKAITSRDRWDVMQCDLVFMNLLGAESVSIGTMIEAGWADAFRKPIILVMEEGNVHEHAILNEVSGFRVHTLNEGINIMKSLLLV